MSVITISLAHVLESGNNNTCVVNVVNREHYRRAICAKCIRVEYTKVSFVEIHDTTGYLRVIRSCGTMLCYG